MDPRQLVLWPQAPLAGGAAATVPAVSSDSLLPRLAVQLGHVELAALDTCTQYFLDNSRAQCTRDAYARDFQAFDRWCSAHGLCSLPASVSTLTRYLTYLAHCGKKVSTVRRARVAIGRAHASAAATRPDRDARIRTLEKGIGRVHGNREKGAQPLLPAHLSQIVGVLNRCARDDRDRALLLVGFAGALRASELVALRIEDVEFRAGGINLSIVRSKADQLGVGHVVAIDQAHNPKLCAVRAVSAWLARVGERDGSLLRRTVGERVTRTPMHPRSVSRVIERLTMRAGILGDYSAHSLRAGLATSAYARGLSDREIQVHGRWKDRRSLDRYIQIGSVEGRRNLIPALY
jgi:site-specific recombinase XerD